MAYDAVVPDDQQERLPFLSYFHHERRLTGDGTLKQDQV